MISFLLAAVTLSSVAVASPVELRSKTGVAKRWEYIKYFDLQGHRGGRGHAIENTLPAFADGLVNGVTTLEMDTGLTKDGHLIVWHDEQIDKTKCLDTKPVFENDPMFPYVGKYIANLTLAQVKSLDCGSLRLDGFPLQLTVPGTKLSTLPEMFDFVSCATDSPVLFNIESKVDGDFHNLTRSAHDFATAFTDLFKTFDPALVDRITHQSFDWRSIKESKVLMPELRTSALFDDTTIYKNPSEGKPGNLTVHGTGASNWLAGIDIDTFSTVSTPQERAVLAAHSIGADFVSPVGVAYASNVTDPSMAGYIPFTTPALVTLAHQLGMQVKPWTIDRLNVIEELVEMGVDGVISDYPRDVRVWAEVKGFNLAPKADEERVGACLAKLNQLV